MATMPTDAQVLEQARTTRDSLYRQLLHETDPVRRNRLFAAWSAACALCRQLVAIAPQSLVRVWTEEDYDRYTAEVGASPWPCPWPG